MSAGGKLFTVFYSFMNTALNLGVQQGMTEKSAAKQAANYALLYLISPLLGMALKAAITPGDSGDDDPEKIARKPGRRDRLPHGPVRRPARTVGCCEDPRRRQRHGGGITKARRACGFSRTSESSPCRRTRAIWMTHSARPSLT